MIKVIKACDSGMGHTTSSPCISLTHTLDADQTRDLIAIAAQRYGIEFVLDSTGIIHPKEATKGAYYMVFVEGGCAPSMHHAARGDAEVEGKRLAAKTNRTVTIVAAVAQIEPQKIIPSEVKELV